MGPISGRARRRNRGTRTCCQKLASRIPQNPIAVPIIALVSGGVGYKYGVSKSQCSNPPILQSSNPPILQSSNPPILQSSDPSTLELRTRAELLPIIDHRKDLATILQNEGKTVGLEIGVQSGAFSETMLKKWTKCEKYTMIDPWEQQAHFQDGANVNNEKQEALLQETKKRMRQFQDNGVEVEIIRDLSTEAYTQIPDDSLDFIYFDGRHDYRGVQDDLRLYWSKLKKGGIFAGHDFENADEVDRWYLDKDGNKQEDGKAVKAAVEEFAELHNKQIVVPRRETKYDTWYFRK